LIFVSAKRIRYEYLKAGEKFSFHEKPYQLVSSFISPPCGVLSECEQADSWERPAFLFS
jgi:hypothetical protein